MPLTDTHCHLDFHQFDPDRSEVLRRAEQAGVVRILVPGLDVTSSRVAVKLAESHPALYAAIGVHPSEAKNWDTGAPDCLHELAAHPRVVAVGEIGLDYYWDAAPHDLQQEVLRVQLSLAGEVGLPVILHMREARNTTYERCASDMLAILETWIAGLEARGNQLAKRPGVLHSFSGSLESAARGIRLGFLIGVTGPVTFRNARTRQAIVQQLPLESILIETDAPFLTPHPYRGQRNEPGYVKMIAEKVAGLHSCHLEAVAEVTTDNAGRLFSWGEAV